MVKVVYNRSNTIRLYSGQLRKEGVEKMEPYYYRTPYIKEFEAEVISCREGKKGYQVILKNTGFYPEGGGQPSDTGFIGAARVEAVHEKDGVVIHETDRALTPGETLTAVIDWDKRFSNMQQHTGEHIVSGLIHRQYGYDNVGFHMGKDAMTIDISGVLTWDQLTELERRANQLIYENLPVYASYPSKEQLQTIDYRSKKELSGRVRLVEVPGTDICACCGTHVMRTGEIGIIKFLSMIHYKGGVRITMLCGGPALLDYERKTDQEIGVSNLLSSKPDRLLEAVERLKQENAGKDARMGEFFKRFLKLLADQFQGEQERLLIFEDGLPPVQLRQYCSLLVDGEKAATAAVCSGLKEGGYSYCIGSRENDMRKLSTELNAVLNGRGGGSSRMVQGTFFADREQIEACFKERNFNGI